MGNFEHTVIFNSTITTDTVADLIDEMNQYPFVNLYFSTDGGMLNEMNILIDFLNYRHSLDSVKLTLYDFVASAGTLVLFDYDGPIFLQKYFRGFMFHAPDLTMGTIRQGVFGAKSKELLDVMNEDIYQSYKNIGLTKADIEKIKKGEDVYVWYDNLSKLKRQLFSDEYTVKQYKLVD